MQRRTKIVATLGPATDDIAVLTEMVRAGLDVARINFSHGAQGEHLRRIELVREAAQRAGKIVGILADLGGPKIRIEGFRDGPIQLAEGAPFALDPRLAPDAGTQGEVGIAYANLHKDVKAGDTLLLADGQIVLDVVAVEGARRDRAGRGPCRSGASIGRAAASGSGTVRQATTTSASGRQRIDYVAVSFAHHAGDIRGRASACAAAARPIVAKIERHESVDNLPSILDETDVVMVARGDLGVEMGYAEVTGLQKTILHQARNKFRVAITATQMMESMIQNAVPTRAEVSDVANAVMDGTDAVMLSAESAVGRYPVKAVQAMAHVIEGAEKYQLSHSRARHRSDGHFGRNDEAIAMAVMYTANHMRVRAIVALTESGSTPLWMSRIRSDIPIYAFTRHAVTSRRVTLYRGVYPVQYDVTQPGTRQVDASIFARLLELRLVEPGDHVIVTSGPLSGVAGGTNAMQILKVTQG